MMVGLDTNVVVRYLLLDDAAQGRKAKALLDGLSEDNPGFISMVVMAEIVWVLRTGYKISHERIIETIEQLINSIELHIEHIALVEEALELYRTGDADFADYLIMLANQAAGCAHTVTFDKIAAKSAGMKLL